jgi:choline dehydrogenase-like flavoprotein
MVAWALNYLLRKRGPLAQTPPAVGGFVKNHAAAALPDNQFHVLPFGVEPPNTDEHHDPPLGGAMCILPGLIYPKSHGSVWLRSGDPTAPPAIDPNYFSDPADLEHLVDGLILAREIAATAPLAQYIGEELWPGPKVTTRDEIRASIRGSVNTIFHPTGTCKMGTDPAAVVDPELRVHGLVGLRIADASIMPRIIGGNTNAPTIMIAEKAADLLLQAR